MDGKFRRLSEDELEEFSSPLRFFKGLFIAAAISVFLWALFLWLATLCLGWGQ